MGGHRLVGEEAGAGEGELNARWGGDGGGRGWGMATRGCEAGGERVSGEGAGMVDLRVLGLDKRNRRD
jgi:hypothetical protein